MITTFFTAIVTIGWIALMLLLCFVIVSAIVLVPIWLFSHMQDMWNYIIRPRP